MEDQTIDIQEQNIAKIEEHLHAWEGTDKIKITIEHFLIKPAGRSIIGYKRIGSTMPGVEDILKELSPAYDEEILTVNGNIIGLKRDGLVVEVGPGCQVMVTVGPFDTIEEARDAYDSFMDDMTPYFTNPYNYKLDAKGYLPFKTTREQKFINTRRYKLISKYLETSGRRMFGKFAMMGTGSTMVSLGFKNEIEAMRIFRIMSLLGPAFYTMCDNAQVFEDNLVRKFPIRMLIFDDLDKERFRVYPEVFDSILEKDPEPEEDAVEEEIPSEENAENAEVAAEETEAEEVAEVYEGAPEEVAEGEEEETEEPEEIELDMNFRTYAEYVYKQHAILGYSEEEGNYISADGKTNAKFYGNKEMSDFDVETLLSLFYFDVILDGSIKVRVADGLPRDHAFAWAAFLKALFASHENIVAIEEMLGNASKDGYKRMLYSVSHQEWKGEAYGTKLVDWFDKLFELAETNLEDASILEPLKVIVAKREDLAHKDRIF
jgi:gamma-glutamylcysteine synthetase